nr:nucleotide pyrophosphohydrolase [Actinomycetota bacterium]
MPRVEVWGLGPSDASLLPAGLLKAVSAVDVDKVIARTSRHPAFDALPPGIATCDDLYDAADSIEDVYAAIVGRLVDSDGTVVYLVPGSPLIAEHTVELLRDVDGIELVIHPALSFLDLAWE